MKKITKFTLVVTFVTSFLAILTVKAFEFLADNPYAGVTQIGFTPEAGKAIGAGIAVGFAGIGAGVGMGTAGSAAIGAISEDSSNLSISLTILLLIEAIAIYGLLISLLLLFT